MTKPSKPSPKGSKTRKPKPIKRGKSVRKSGMTDAEKRASLKITKAPEGRPALYSPELAAEFCLRVASGRAISNVVTDPDMPPEGTVYRWREENREFRELLTRARDIRDEKFPEQMIGLALGIVGEASGPKADPAKVRVAIEGLDKAVRLMKERTVKVEVTGKGGGPVATITADRLASMSDEELAAIERATAILAGTASNAGRPAIEGAGPGGAGAPARDGPATERTG